MSSDILNQVVGWRQESLPISKQDIVNEISRRLEPILTQLLQRIDDMDMKINDIALKQKNIIEYMKIDNDND